MVETDLKMCEKLLESMADRNQYVEITPGHVLRI